MWVSFSHRFLIKCNVSAPVLRICCNLLWIWNDLLHSYCILHLFVSRSECHSFQRLSNKIFSSSRQEIWTYPDLRRDRIIISFHSSDYRFDSDFISQSIQWLTIILLHVFMKIIDSRSRCIDSSAPSSSKTSSVILFVSFWFLRLLTSLLLMYIPSLLSQIDRSGRMEIHFFFYDIVSEYVRLRTSTSRSYVRTEHIILRTSSVLNWSYRLFRFWHYEIVGPMTVVVLPVSLRFVNCVNWCFLRLILCLHLLWWMTWWFLQTAVQLLHYSWFE